MIKDATEVSSEAETESPSATQESETETTETEETQESHEADEDEESGEEEKHQFWKSENYCPVRDIAVFIIQHSLKGNLTPSVDCRPPVYGNDRNGRREREAEGKIPTLLL